MATLKPASKISARPQIKAVKQPIPRQVIFPKKAQPAVKAPARPLVAPPLPMQFQNPVNPTMGVSSVGSVGYPASMGGGTSTISGRGVMPDGSFYEQVMPTQQDVQQFTSMPSGISGKGVMPDGSFYEQAYPMQQGGQQFVPMPSGISGVGVMPDGSFYEQTMPTQQGGGQFVRMPSGISGVGVMPDGSFYEQQFGQPYNQPQSFQPQSFQQLGMQPQQGFSATPNMNYNQQGFVPVGGYNPQNTSNGSFGAIQQPMGGYGNIGSLLGKG